MDIYVSFTMAENQTREKRNGRLLSAPALPVLAAVRSFYNLLRVHPNKVIPILIGSPALALDGYIGKSIGSTILSMLFPMSLL